MRKVIAIATLILILAGVNWSISKKEEHLATGDIAFLKLRPVDPRSLMQGDFMALRFELADKIIENIPESQFNKNGHAVVTLDVNGLATFKNLYKEEDKLKNNEIKMQYRVRNGRVKFATNAFFFEEGTASIYEKAKFGQFRVNDEGELLLTAMFDEYLKKLGRDNKL